MRAFRTRGCANALNLVLDIGWETGLVGKALRSRFPRVASLTGVGVAPRMAGRADRTGARTSTWRWRTLRMG